MANGDVDVTEGSGLKVATYTISEDAVTRNLQRISVNDSAGADILGTTADAASATTSIKAALRAIATALGVTALDLGSGTGGTRTIRTTLDTASAGIIPLVAHDAADSGEPLKTGGRAVAGLSGLTLVAAGDRTDSLHGTDGAKYVRPHCGLEDIVTGNATNTDGTSTSCIASSGAGVKTYLTSVVLCNTSATAITVDIKDGATTKVSLPLPAGSGCVFNPPVPIPGTAATAWSFDPSAAATTVTCSMIGFKSKV